MGLNFEHEIRAGWLMDPGYTIEAAFVVDSMSPRVVQRMAEFWSGDILMDMDEYDADTPGGSDE